MTFDETAKLMAIFKTAYPAYYRDMKTEDIEAAVSLWTEILWDYSPSVVMLAAKRHISGCKFAPVISELFEQIKAIEKENLKWPISDLEIQSMINLRKNLNLEVPPEYLALAQKKSIPLLEMGATT